MATIEGRRLCDVCRSPMEAERTVAFAHDGAAYEVDLCAPHVRKLEKVLAEFMAGGRRVEPAG